MLDAPLSHYLLTASQCRDIDRQTIEETGIDGFTLMEVAGSSAARHIAARQIRGQDQSYDIREQDWPHGLYLCGKGNNAGDALVVARYLLQHTISATIVFLNGSGDLSPEGKKNLELLRKFGSRGQLAFVESWDEFDQTEEWDFIVDGMLGTGLSSDLRGDYLKGVNWANDQDTPVLAMDIPTGLHADTGKMMGACIRAEQTFAFGGRKLGFYLEEGPSNTGNVIYCELPFPQGFKAACNTFLLDESWVPPHHSRPGRHKYASGVLYIVAGSEGLTGAAILAAQSAWAEGLGAIILICPRGLLSVYEHNLPSIIKKPVGRKSDEYFMPRHLSSLLSIVGEKKGAVLFGPGLGRREDTVTFTTQFLSRNPRHTVIDADALWCLAQSEQWDKPDDVEWILTPHPGELSRFADYSIEDGAQRLRFVRTFASNKQITILSKGMPGIIGTSTGKCYLTNYNTRYFARAGSGDILAGKTGAYLTHGQTPAVSCAAGLLQGKRKLDHYLKTEQDLPEPSDFI